MEVWSRESLAGVLSFSAARLFSGGGITNMMSHGLEHPNFFPCLWLTAGKPAVPYDATLVEKLYQMHWFAFLN